MRKKYLSALLFGALFFASAATFTSCKDYDDDISNLQNQITANADAIKTLQDKINGGKWLTNVESITGGFKVTFNDGTSYTIVNGKDGINGTDGKDGQDGAPGKDGVDGAPGKDGVDGTDGKDGKNGTQITIGEDGYWYFDGVKSNYKAVADGSDIKVNVPYVGEDGYWYFYNEEGTAVKSEYKANGSAYAVKVNGGYNIYLQGEDGKLMSPLFVPGAAAVITEMVIVTEDPKVDINKYTFSPSAADRAAWEAATGRKLTTAKFIIASNSELRVQVNPTAVDATGLKMTLVDGKNGTLSTTKGRLQFVAEEYDGYVNTRAANGLYDLSLKQAEVNSANDLDVNGKGYYAINVEDAYRTRYSVEVTTADATANIGAVLLNGETVQASNKLDVAKKHVVSVEHEADLRDIYLSASDEDKNLFGLQFDGFGGFTITKVPDQITAAGFDLTVHTIDNSGKVATQTINIQLSDAISADALYNTRVHAIVDDANGKNFFSADMATFTNKLGTNLDIWKKKVSSYTVAYYTDAACEKEVTNAAGVALSFLKGDGSALTGNAIKDAANMKFAVTNADASQVFTIGKTYYAKVTFVNSSNETLNSLVVPFKFTIPGITDQFAKESAVFKGDVAYAYMNADDLGANGLASYKLTRAFVKYMAGAKLSLDSKTKISGNHTSADLAQFTKNTFDADTKIELKKIGVDDATNTPAGYGQELIVKASQDAYLGWTYPEGEGEYTFKVKVMSPLFEGEVVAEGGEISIKATDVNGYRVTDRDLKGYTYNGIDYSVFNKSRADFRGIKATVSSDRRVKILKNGTDGQLVIAPQNIAVTSTEEINVDVIDIWGYTKANTIKVKVTVGE